MNYVEQLAPAGLKFLKTVELEFPFIPPTLATLAQGYVADSMDLPRSFVSCDEADFVEKANEGWLELSQRGGLFDSDREFLVAVKVRDDHGDWWWARVRLVGSWDIMGSGAAAALGNGYGVPEFAMLSVSGHVLVCGMEGNGLIGSVLVEGFNDFPGLRELAEWKAGWTGTSGHERAATRRWLDWIASSG